MEKLKPIVKSRINKAYDHPENNGLLYKKYGKYENIKDYSEREIIEMLYGIYKTSKILIASDTIINLNDVVESTCILADVSYIKKPTLEDYKVNSHNTIDNIRTFYIKDYFLITDDKNGKRQEHRITDFLRKIGFLRVGRGKHIGYYSISNSYKTLQGGLYPKDLFYPIKRYINGLFFSDDYKISKFSVDSPIKIVANIK
ncbi:hypothetical protein GCM10023210_04530 [Chryseobacterium ginsengisoli]|uniref:Uncharacterized protein n=1 Tax=Chryseobacterium ginsengisoli TaxID=363853 RepID=A0ABP9LVI2_9FLAO